MRQLSFIINWVTFFVRLERMSDSASTVSRPPRSLNFMDQISFYYSLGQKLMHYGRSTRRNFPHRTVTSFVFWINLTLKALDFLVPTKNWKRGCFYPHPPL